MTDQPDGSVTRWIGDLVAGDAAGSAAQKLWERYFDRLVHLARDRLRAPRSGGCRGRRAGRLRQFLPWRRRRLLPPP